MGAGMAVAVLVVGVGVVRLAGNGTVNVGLGLGFLNAGKGSGGSGGGGGREENEYEGSGASVCLRTPLIRAVVGLRHPSLRLRFPLLLSLVVTNEIPFAFEQEDVTPELGLELELVEEMEEGVKPRTRSSRAHSFAAKEQEDPDSCVQEDSEEE